MRKAATADAQPMTRVALDNYFGGGGQEPFDDPSILEEFTFWDQLILSASYIGPMIATDTTPPAAPTGLVVQ